MSISAVFVKLEGFFLRPLGGHTKAVGQPEVHHPGVARTKHPLIQCGCIDFGSPVLGLEGIGDRENKKELFAQQVLSHTNVDDVAWTVLPLGGHPGRAIVRIDLDHRAFCDVNAAIEIAVPRNRRLIVPVAKVRSIDLLIESVCAHVRCEIAPEVAGEHELQPPGLVRRKVLLRCEEHGIV